MGAIADLNELSAIVPDDWLLANDISDASDKHKKIKAGTFPFKFGTPVAGKVARWKDANTVEDGGVTLTGTGTLALGGYTLTAPNTGTIVTHNAAQVLGNKTINEIALTYQNMAVNQLAGLNVWTAVTNGLIIIHNLSYGTVCAFLARAGANTVVELSWDNTSAYSATANNAGTVNFYYDSTYGYVIQNKLAGSAYIGVHAIGA